MYQNLLVLGAAGEISVKLISQLLETTDFNLFLYGRNVSQRLEHFAGNRIQFIDASFDDREALKKAFALVDVVYLNSMEYHSSTQTILQVMSESPVKRLIAAGMAGVENEVPEGLSNWTQMVLPNDYIEGEIRSARLLKGSNLDYTLLRLTWLFDSQTDREVELVPEGQAFADAEVSREAVVDVIQTILLDEDQSKWIRRSFGVGKPGTHFDKPSFY